MKELKINRSNYEEYFLLYADDELNAQQKQEVEAFIFLNEDLAEELEMLQQTKLSGEEKIFFDKTVLYKKESGNINITNAEEFFLLHIDNELNEKQEAELNSFLIAQPVLKENLELLQQTILPKEKIEFTNKKILYRSEKEKPKIIPFNWLKLAVAAAFIGVAGLVWFLIPAEKKENVAVENNYEVKKVLPQNIQQSTQKNNTENIAVTETKSKTEKKIFKGIKPMKKNIAESKKENIQKNIQPQTQLPGTDIAQHQPESTDNKTQEEPVAVTGNSIENIAQQNKIDQSSEISEKKSEKAKSLYAANTTDNNIVHPAVYHELNTADDEDKSLYIGSVELNKNKLRGFMKKATKMFGSKAKDVSEENN